MIVVYGVTERYRREQRLDELASIGSHDPRNPLNVAQGHVEIATESGDVDSLDTASDALDAWTLENCSLTRATPRSTGGGARDSPG